MADSALSFLTAQTLARAMPGCRDPAGWVEPLRAACRRYGIDTPLRVAAFLSQIGHESQDLNVLSESFNYSVARLREIFPTRVSPAAAERLGRTAKKSANQPGIADLVYGGRLGNSVTGDGYRFRGAGAIQVTGYSNHAAVAEEFDLPIDKTRDWLLTKEGAALSAAWFWSRNRCNNLADARNLTQLCRVINGGTNGLADRKSRFVQCCAALGFT